MASGFKKLETVLSVFGLILLLAVSGGVTIEVFARKFLNASLGGADELSGYAFAIFTSFAFVLAAFEKANIRIDLFRTAMPRRIKLAMDVIAAASLLVFVGLMTWRAVLLAANSFERGSKAITPLATPLYIPQSIWAAGLVIFTCVLATMFLRALIALLQGRMSLAYKLLGPSHEEDHSSEYSDAALETRSSKED